MVICFWMITEGTGELLVHRGFDAFYDGQADSLAHGHWDVSRDAIIGEAFVLHGKNYGYYGFTPALPRILLNRLFPSMYGRWTRLLMLLWIACVMAAIMAFLDEFETRSSPFVLAVAVLGSTLFFLCSHAIVYHEAIMTGAALALWAYLFFSRYLRRPRIWFLAVACVLAFLSFFARLTVGAGPMLAASFLCLALLCRRFATGVPFLNWSRFPSPAAAGKHAVFLALCLGISFSAYVSVNHAKFGTWINPAPYQYNVQYDAARLARLDGKINHLSNIPFSAGAYFGPRGLKFSQSFPWIELVNRGPGPGSGAKIDLIEGYSSIPAAMPGLAILAILGIVFAAQGSPNAQRRVIPILVAAFAAGSLTLSIAYITYRYVHDFYPFLVIAAILGVGAVPWISRKPLRVSLRVLIVAAGIWSIAANFAIALKWQREDFWAASGPNAAFLGMRHRADALFLKRKPEPVLYKIGDQVGGFPAGQLLTVVAPPATYRYDGRRWNYVAGAQLHLFRLLVKFPAARRDTKMALWFAGGLGNSDAVYVVYLGPTQIEFCSDNWGMGGSCGAITEIVPGREYHVRIDADRLNAALTVQLDGRTVLAAPMQFHVWTDRDVLLGKSLAPSAHGGEFTGEIKADQEPR